MILYLFCAWVGVMLTKILYQSDIELTRPHFLLECGSHVLFAN